MCCILGLKGFAVGTHNSELTQQDRRGKKAANLV